MGGVVLPRAAGDDEVGVFGVQRLPLPVDLPDVHTRRGGNAPAARLNLDTFQGKFLLCVWVFLIAMLMYCGNSAFIYANF